MPSLYTLTITRKAQVAFWSNYLEIYIDNQFAGRIRNGGERQIQLTKDQIKVYIKDTSRFNFIPFVSKPVIITAQEAQTFQFQIQYGISNQLFIILILILLGSLLMVTYFHKAAYFLTAVIPFIYLFGFRILNKEHYLFMESKLKEIADPQSSSL